MSAVTTMLTTGPCKNYIVMEELEALLSPEQAAKAFAKWLPALVSGFFRCKRAPRLVATALSVGLCWNHIDMEDLEAVLSSEQRLPCVARSHVKMGLQDSCVYIADSARCGSMQESHYHGRSGSLPEL